MASPSPAPAGADGGTLAFNLTGMALLALMAALGAAYLLDGHLRAREAPPVAVSGEVRPTLSGHELRIPRHWLRDPEAAEAGFANQIDLRVTLADDTAVDVTLLPRSRVRPGALMLDAVYLHQFDAETLGGPRGLVGKPLKVGTGLPPETVWYDPLSPDPFVAKCQAPVAEDEPERCLRTLVLASGIAAAYAFERPVLEDWRAFDAEMEALMRAIGAR